jgi:Zn finger protein HypA/HybF involved in hydrogenase expression
VTALKAIADELAATQRRRARLADQWNAGRLPTATDALVRSAALQSYADGLAFALGIVQWRSEKKPKPIDGGTVDAGRVYAACGRAFDTTGDALTHTAYCPDCEESMAGRRGRVSRAVALCGDGFDSFESAKAHQGICPRCQQIAELRAAKGWA